MKDSPVVLVTGAARGIGREIALAFARDRFRVALNYRASSEKIQEVQKETEACGAESGTFQADVSDSSQAADMIGKVTKFWGRIDVLINNAGIARDRTILKMTDEEWTGVLNVNLNGAFWCLRECAKAMAKQKEGSIVNISSIVALRGGIGNSNYAASKGGLLALTKAAAKELGRFNVRVNAVLPGFHLTDMSRAAWEKYEERILSEHALGRTTDVGELAQFILFIAKQKSASGQVFNFESRVL